MVLLCVCMRLTFNKQQSRNVKKSILQIFCIQKWKKYSFIVLRQLLFKQRWSPLFLSCLSVSYTLFVCLSVSLLRVLTRTLVFFNAKKIILCAFIENFSFFTFFEILGIKINEELIKDMRRIGEKNLAPYFKMLIKKFQCSLMLGV